MKLTGENRSTRGKSCPNVTSSTTNPTDWPGIEPGPLQWYAGDLNAWAMARPFILCYYSPDPTRHHEENNEKLSASRISYLLSGVLTGLVLLFVTDKFRNASWSSRSRSASTYPLTISSSSSSISFRFFRNIGHLWSSSIWLLPANLLTSSCRH
jgi:hypothetical protein